MITTKRVYESPAPADGYRVLVERLWPRGLTREAAALDAWLKDLAPSAELRRAFHGGEVDWPGFAERYRAELALPQAAGGLADLRHRARKGAVTLLYARSDRTENSAAVLRDVLLEASG